VAYAFCDVFGLAENKTAEIGTLYEYRRKNYTIKDTSESRSNDMRSAKSI
jgi:hypothetical protein